MNAQRYHWLITMLTLVCFLLVAGTVSADAQKKQKPKAATKEAVKETPKEQPKEEAKEEEEEKAEEVTTPAPAPSATVLPNKFLDVIKQYVGKKTNLGTLRKIAGDYLLFEDDLTTILVPLTNIQSARLVKDDETTPANLEIKLIAKD